MHRHLTGLLHLLQFGDSALPIGSFSFSHGLESAVQQGFVHNAETLTAFVKTALQQAATTDGIALVRAYEAAILRDIPMIAQIDRMTFDRKLNEEVRQMSVRMGRKLSELTVAVVSDDLNGDWLERIKRAETPGTHPVSLALALSALGVDARDGFAVQQYGVATTILGAALRLMRLSFIDTQRILHEVFTTIPDICDEVMNASLSDMASFAPMNDIFAAVHVKSYVRMFMN